MSLFGFFKLFIYLWLCWVSVAVWSFLSLQQVVAASGCGAPASHCSGFSCCRTQTPGCAQASVVAARGLTSCSSWALRHRLIVVHGIFLDQGSNLCLLLWQAISLPLSHRGSPVFLF